MENHQTRASRLAEVWRPTVLYVMQTEAHVYALSVAASVLLSVFPFLIVMMSLFRYWLQWPAGVHALELALTDFFPGDMGVFITRNLTSAVESRASSLVESAATCWASAFTAGSVP